MHEAFPSRTGADLIALRKHLGIGPTAVAQELGITAVSIWRWEHDKVRVTPLVYARYEAACLRAFDRLVGKAS